MSWWVKLTDENSKVSLLGPYSSEADAQADVTVAEEREWGTCSDPYEADENEPLRLPRPCANTTTKDGTVEHWTDGSTRLLT